MSRLQLSKVRGTKKERAALAHRKSVVLLRNENDALPLTPKTKVFFESLQRNGRGSVSEAPNIYSLNDNKYDVEFVKTPAEADVILLRIIPTGNALFGSVGEPSSFRRRQLSNEKN